MGDLIGYVENLIIARGADFDFVAFNGHVHESNPCWPWINTAVMPVWQVVYVCRRPFNTKGSRLSRGIPTGVSGRRLQPYG